MIFPAMSNARGPLQRTMAIAPRPGGVEMAHIVSSFEYMAGLTHMQAAKVRLIIQRKFTLFSNNNNFMLFLRP
jgi:hypothetical protein